MLHKLELSQAIEEPLAQAVRVQCRLLAYAAHFSSFVEAACAEFVDDDPALEGRGAAVARWVADSPKNRIKHLNDFGAHADASERRAWADVLTNEALEMLTGVPDSLTRITKDAPKWQESGGEFLQLFYDALSSDSGLPGEMLGLSRGNNFGRQHFLHAFQDANKDLYVCAACDETRISTRHKGHIYADIDHFFPQSLYPHLSVHPYNLVPICHGCNSGTKRDTDPLQDGAARVRPADLALPYRSLGIAEQTVVAVDLKAWRDSMSPFTLRPRPDGAAQSQIDGLARVVGIPERWNDPATVHEIGHTLFRRLKQFIRARPGLLERGTDDALLQRKIDEFLGILREDDVGRDPLSVPLQWLLVHLSQPDTSSARTPMLTEIRQWIEPGATEAERVRLGKELRAML